MQFLPAVMVKNKQLVTQHESTRPVLSAARGSTDQALLCRCEPSCHAHTLAHTTILAYNVFLIHLTRVGINWSACDWNWSTGWEQHRHNTSTHSIIKCIFRECLATLTSQKKREQKKTFFVIRYKEVKNKQTGEIQGQILKSVETVEWMWRRSFMSCCKLIKMLERTFFLLFWLDHHTLHVMSWVR